MCVISSAKKNFLAVNFSNHSMSAFEIFYKLDDYIDIFRAKHYMNIFVRVFSKRSTPNEPSNRSSFDFN